MTTVVWVGSIPLGCIPVTRFSYVRIHARKRWNRITSYLWNNWIYKRTAFNFVYDLMCICYGHLHLYEILKDLNFSIARVKNA
jgi:hypothetical protein